MRRFALLALVFAVATCGDDNISGSGGAGGAGGAGGSGGAGGAGGTGGTGGAGGTGGTGGTAGSGGTGGSGGSVGAASVLEHHGSPSRAGAYVVSTLTHAMAATMHVDTTFTATYSGPTYAQPLFVDGGAGGRDMLFVATEQNQISAFDASNGTMIWRRTLGNPMPLNQLPCGNISPLGTTGTPIIDGASRTMFLDAMINQGGAHHQVFALSIDDGSTRTGWPVDANTSFHSGSVNFASPVQGERGALALLSGTLYVPYGGHYGDCGSYHGWIAAIPINNPAQPAAWATTDTESGIWQPGGLSSDGTYIYGVTGNGAGGANWGDSEMVGRFTGAAVFSNQTQDYWVPTNWQALDAGDIDMSGSGAIPIDVAGATPSALVAAFGKDGNVYLINRTNMGGISAPVATLHASSSEIINASAAYKTAMGTYLVFRGSGVGPCGGTQSNLVAVKITAASPPTLSIAWCANAGGGRGSPIATTTDGTAEAVVWAVGAEGDNRLHGFDGDTGAVVFAGGGAGDVMTSSRRFITPIVAKGRIFVAADNQLYAFKTN
jgi:hypothetical protein